jgi:hypothetical protein
MIEERKYKRHFITITEEDYQESLNSSANRALDRAVIREIGSFHFHGTCPNAYKRFKKNGNVFLPGKYLILIPIL